MLTVVPPITGQGRADSWCFLLTGLWWSGLRLDESLELWWDRDDRLSVDLSGRRPMLRISAESEKGHKDRLLPMAPEFAQMLLDVPEDQRFGRVFNPAAERRRGDRLATPRVTRTISEIGRAANVKVWTDPRTGRPKFATAHDLCRTFGERWSLRVMPTILQVLMRHESIETTLRYYVGRNAEQMADVVWAAVEAETGGALGGVPVSAMSAKEENP